MSDFSLFSLFTAGLACLLPLASAYTQPVGAEPSGNPIYTPGLHDVVPAGEPYTITWDPTTSGTVTLVLLKGPSNNAVPQYAIVEEIPNNGNYIWTPASDLEPSNGDTGYGIQLIVDATGQYQYTTQFGISNDNYTPSGYGSTSTSSATSSAWGYTTSSASSMILTTGYAAPTGYPHPSANGTHAHPTGWAPHNTTMKPYPTGHITKTTLMSSSAPVASSSYAATTSAAPGPQPTNAGTSLAASFVGLVFAAGVAVFAL